MVARGEEGGGESKIGRNWTEVDRAGVLGTADGAGREMIQCDFDRGGGTARNVLPERARGGVQWRITSGCGMW